MYSYLWLWAAGASLGSGLVEFLLARRARTWVALGALAALLALTVSLLPSIPSFIEIADGGDPIYLLGMWLSVPLMVTATLIGSCVGVALAVREPHTARNTALVSLAACLPLMAISFGLHFMVLQSL